MSQPIITEPPLTSRAVRVLAGIVDAKQGQPANYVAFLDLIARKIREVGDSTAVLEEVTALLHSERYAKAAR
ncbi:hypothetical protein [Streptomyces antarcticus]|uniref:hypothetical protein n=1 Tax=Streptomyces antarcticus TaxID=2996458 RepID=UPI00226D9466|nr:MULTISPECIES: hypothetical protein [unclassified Streptomyces]MCY0943571.1 hypothetical protein [Streptomyces sp. H34-AA3]MCZ4083520.1 hypothetical protein [Streptomyces sp. H34-S5]